nr:hypothetical protein [uncultured Chitinophaga sp.]
MKNTINPQPILIQVKPLFRYERGNARADGKIDTTVSTITLTSTVLGPVFKGSTQGAQSAGPSIA